MEIYKSETGKNEVLEEYRKILADWPVQNLQYEVQTILGATFIIESGSKDNHPLILLHGSSSNSYTWYSDVVSLSQSFNVYAVDIVGEAGLSAVSRPSYESGAYSVWLKDIITALKLDSVSIAAMSLGGWMALNFASSFRSMVDNLILLCPGGLAREKTSFIWKAVFFSLLGKWGQRQTLKLVGSDNITSSSLFGTGGEFEFSSLIFKYFKPRTSKMPLLSDESLSRLSMPVLMFFGDSDQLIPADKSIRRLKQFTKQAEVVLLKDTGHLILNQTDRIIEFLKNNQGNNAC